MWPLLLLLVVFVVLKFSHLSYPYYWDESWSYAPGVRLMYLHGPTLLPGEIDTFYSRGHPLFFYASIASWLKVFGDGHFARHAFALFVSCLTLGMLYAFCQRFISRPVAIFTTVLLAAQVVFFVQASYVLPEVMVALFSFASLAFFAMRRYGWCSLSLAALLLTKESGLAIGFVVGCAALMNMLSREELSWEARFTPIGMVLLATLPVVAFFGLQRMRLGWFFYPEHTAMMQLRWDYFYSYFRGSLELIFREERLYLPAFLLPAIIYAFLQKQYSAAILLLPAGTTALILLGPEKGAVLWFVLWLASIVGTAALVLYRQLMRRGHPVLARMIALTTPAFVVYLCFCALNFFTTRYLMPAFVIVVFWIGLTLWLMAKESRPVFISCAVLGVVAAVFSFRSSTGLGDVEMGSFHAMRVQKAMVNFLENGNRYQSVIGGGSFQDREHLTKPATGFLKSEQAFSKVRWEIDDSTQLTFFNNIEPDDRYKDLVANPSFKRIYRYEEGKAWTEVYERVR